MRISLFAIALWGGTLALSAEPIPLQVGPRADFEVGRAGAAWSLETTGGNPHFWSTEIPAAASIKTHPILRFEYFSQDPLPGIVVSLPREEGRSTCPPQTLPLSEGWREAAFDLRLAHTPYVTGSEQRFLLRFRTGQGHRFQVRNLGLRAPLPEEEVSAQRRAAVARKRLEDAEAYRVYLERTFPVQLDRVRVEESVITVFARWEKAAFPEGAKLGLVEHLLHRPSYLESARPPESIVQVSPEATEVEFRVPRVGEARRDRATSRWKVVLLGEGAPVSQSAAHYPTEYAAGVQRDLVSVQPGGVKGLGGIPALNREHEIFDLGIHHATKNIVVNTLLSPTPRPRWAGWTFEGHTYYLNKHALERLDSDVRILSDRGICVSSILLLGNSRDAGGRPQLGMVHPEALAAGKFAMPDLATADGARLYLAAAHLLTERYTRPEGPGYKGRITNWILHNEIDQSGTWTTMGDQPMPRYLETYLRSARLFFHSARRFDPRARVFISLTHHWTKKSGGPQTFVVRDLLDLFAEGARKEGEFEWGVAYHPYPRSLRVPETWRDEVTYSPDAEYVTPRNLGVLIDYLRQPGFLYGGMTRGILLSEQGINARSLSREDQEIQAAGIVYFFDQVRRFPEIEAFHYHAYRDNPEVEGGLLLGLTHREHGHHLAWDVYRALGTEEEAEARKLADEILGAEPD